MAVTPVVAAQQTSQHPATDVVEAEGPSATEQTIDVFMGHFYRGEFAKALKAADDIAVDPANRKGRGLVTGMRAAAMMGLKRKAEALRLFNDAETLHPDEPLIINLKMMSALMVEDHFIALTALDRMIARFPDALHEVEPRLVWQLLREAPVDQASRNADRWVALARIGFGAEYGDGNTAYAIEILVKRGDLHGASELLRYLDEPDKIQEMLVMKSYAAFWPAVEAHAGLHLGNVIKTNVDEAAAAYGADPENWIKFTNYTEALRLAGRPEEAIALQAKLPMTPESISEIDELAGWAVNNVAYALRAAGRPDDADRLLATLTEASMPDEHWRVNMIINRLAFLVEGGQFDRALLLLAGAEKSAMEDGNSYSQQLVRAFQYCTYRRTEKLAEASRIRAEMMKFAKDARIATVDMLICAGELEDAERIALEGVSDDGFHASFVRSLQRKPLIGQLPAVWFDDWLALRQRPAITKEFERLGRDLPDRMHAVLAAS